MDIHNTQCTLQTTSIHWANLRKFMSITASCMAKGYQQDSRHDLDQIEKHLEHTVSQEERREINWGVFGAFKFDHLQPFTSTSASKRDTCPYPLENHLFSGRRVFNQASFEREDRYYTQARSDPTYRQSLLESVSRFYRTVRSTKSFFSYQKESLSAKAV